MRILFYNHAAEISGAERSLLALMAQARAAGHRVTLCAPPGPLADAARAQEFPVVPAQPLVLGYTRNPLLLLRWLLGTLGPAWTVARAVRRDQPEVLHANSVRSGLVAAVALRLVRSRPRLVVHVRDVLGSGLPGRAVATLLAHEADALVAIARYVAVPLGWKARVVHNAVDPLLYARNERAGQTLRASLAVPPAAPLLAVVGQLTPWKGHLDALQAIAALRQQRPEAHLLIAGTAKFTGKHRRYDTLAYERELRAAQPYLAGHVHFPGEVADAAAIYSAAALLLVPSWEEPFGRVVIEAMAAGCPVLATRAGGIPEIITHGVDGWLIPPRDPAALAQAILRLLGDADLRASLAVEGQAAVSRRFSHPGYLEHIWPDALGNAAGRHQ